MVDPPRDRCKDTATVCLPVCDKRILCHVFTFMQSKTEKRSASAPAHGWTFLTNHTHVLVLLSRVPDLRIRDMADQVGITQRAVQRILAELSEEGILSIRKQGRRNQYLINRKTRLRHPLENRHTIGEVLDILSK